MRGCRRHFTHSKVLAWVSVDRAVQMIEQFAVSHEQGKQLLPHLSALRERIHGPTGERARRARLATAGTPSASGI